MIRGCPRRTSLVPRASPCFVLCLIRVETEGLRLPEAGGDHFHCTVELSPGHIRCRKMTVAVPKVRGFTKFRSSTGKHFRAFFGVSQEVFYQYWVVAVLPRHVSTSSQLLGLKGSEDSVGREDCNITFEPALLACDSNLITTYKRVWGRKVQSMAFWGS